MKRSGAVCGNNLQLTGVDLGRDNRRTPPGCCSAVTVATDAVAPDAQVCACSDFYATSPPPSSACCTSTLSTLALFVAATFCKSAQTDAALRLATKACCGPLTSTGVATE